MTETSRSAPVARMAIGLFAAMLGAAALFVALAPARAEAAGKSDTSGSMSCASGKCTCTAADYNTCVAVSDQFCGKSTMSCSADKSGATCTCKSANITARPFKRPIQMHQSTMATPR